MKGRLVLIAIVILLVSWFALDAVAEIILLLDSLALARIIYEPPCLALCRLLERVILAISFATQ